MIQRKPGPPWAITEPIAPEHRAFDFRCSDPATEAFYRRASALDRADIVRTYVLHAGLDDPPGVPDVLGYYALAATVIDSGASKRWPAVLAEIPTPATLIVYFGVHAALEGTGGRGAAARRRHLSRDVLGGHRRGRWARVHGAGRAGSALLRACRVYGAYPWVAAADVHAHDLGEPVGA